MKAKVNVRTDKVISRIDDRLYSSFIEHMGRAIYTGVYEPDHPTADEFGFRQDVAEVIKPLNVSHVRYPGGNFLSGYNWKDGIGPKDQRPVRPELAWFSLEPNEVGTDEFLSWLERLGTKPMLGVNLGTGTPQSALELLEYVNGTTPTYYADLRRKNGREEPYDVRLWCLGNEMDGPWQICGKTAEEYARIACETAKMMKWYDPSIELVACGSSNPQMPTYGEWEKTVLKHCAEHVDYLSLHQYFSNADGDTPSFLAQSVVMEKNIKYVASLCKAAKEEQKLDHDIYLSFDEWNVWYHFRQKDVWPEQWIKARPIDEEEYIPLDAVVVACALNTLIRNSDTVKIACLAQLVNALSPILTEPGGKVTAQCTYYPFLYASKFSRGTAVKTETECASYSCAAADDVPYLDCSAVQCDDGSVSVLLANRADEEAEIELAFAGSFGSTELYLQAEEGAERIELPAGAPVKLPALSWAMLRLIP